MGIRPRRRRGNPAKISLGLRYDGGGRTARRVERRRRQLRQRRKRAPRRERIPPLLQRPKPGLQLDTARGGVEVVVLDGAAVDVLELADQRLGVAGLVAAGLGVERPDAVPDAVGAQHPVALVLGRLARVSGFRGGDGSARIEHEVVAEALLAGVQRLPGDKGVQAFVYLTKHPILSVVRLYSPKIRRSNMKVARWLRDRHRRSKLQRR